jgi:hypothetical protein
MGCGRGWGDTFVQQLAFLSWGSRDEIRFARAAANQQPKEMLEHFDLSDHYLTLRELPPPSHHNFSSPALLAFHRDIACLAQVLSSFRVHSTKTFISRVRRNHLPDFDGLKFSLPAAQLRSTLTLCRNGTAAQTIRMDVWTLSSVTFGNRMAVPALTLPDRATLPRLAPRQTCTSLNLSNSLITNNLLYLLHFLLHQTTVNSPAIHLVL